VRAAAVVGLPDQEWGQIIVAAVAPHPGHDLTEDEVRAWARTRLRGSRTPDRVVFRAELPHSPLGKLLRRELIADLQSESVPGRTS
jgi:acyl-CoA synthetase (AMP-forming)/AMP-acid ligase II